MKKPVLAFDSALRRNALRSSLLILLSSLLAASLSLAQEKGAASTHAAGWVVLPINEYRVLRAKAYPTEPVPEPPPLDATLTRVEYDLHVLGDLATGSAKLTVDVLKDGWVRVPIPPGLLVRDAQLDGKALSLVSGDKGKAGTHVAALLSHEGRSVLTLNVDVPVTSATGEETLSLPSTDSGVTRAAVHLYRFLSELGKPGPYDASKGNVARVWRLMPRILDLAQFDDAKVVAMDQSNWSIAPTLVDGRLPRSELEASLKRLNYRNPDAIYAAAQFEVAKSGTVRIQLPEKITVNQVGGAMVADWEMNNGELVVTFLEPVEHSARFVISAEARLPRDGVIDIPMLRLLGTERDSGGVAVEILGAGEIKDQKAHGLEDADATDLGTMIANRQSPALVAFRARAGEAGATRSLSINVARYDQQAVLMANIEEARYDVLISADGKELVQARYAVRNNQRNFVKITLVITRRCGRGNLRTAACCCLWRNPEAARMRRRSRWRFSIW